MIPALTGTVVNVDRTFLAVGFKALSLCPLNAYNISATN